MIARHTTVDQLFLQLVTASATLGGQEYVERMPRILADAWGCSAAFISESRADDRSSGSLTGFWGRVDVLPHPVAVEGFPWFGDIADATVYHPAGVAARFPKDSVLKAQRAEVYMAVPLRGMNGECIGYVGLIDDEAWSAARAAEAESLLRQLSARASAELERRRSLARLEHETHWFRELADTSPDAFIFWSGSEPPRIEYVNAAIRRLTGYSKAQVRSDPGTVLQAVLSTLPLPAGVSETQRGLVRVPLRSGGERLLDATVTRTGEGADGAHYCCTLREPSGDAGAPRESSRLREVLERLPFATIVLRDGRVDFMNRRAIEVTGAGPSDVLDLDVTFEDNDGADVITSLREWVRRVPRGRSVRPVIRIKARRTRLPARLVQMRTRAVTLEDGEHVILAPLDITDERRDYAEAAERASLDERILAALPIDVTVTDGDGRIIVVTKTTNPGVREAASHTACELPSEVGADFVEVCRREAASGSEPARKLLLGIGSVLSRSIPQFVVDFDVDGVDGQAKQRMLVVVTPLAGGGAVVMQSNITRAKQMQDQIVQSEERERRLLNSLPDQLIRVGLDGRIREVYSPAAKSTMVPLLSRVSHRRHIRDEFSAEDAERVLAAMEAAALGNMVTHCAIEMTQSGSAREYEIRIVPLEDEFLLYARDRTAEQWQPRAAGASPEDGGRRSRIVRENPYGLTFREVAVLELLAQGASDKEIAAKLGVSVFTVYKHVSKILHKMSVSSRTEASLLTVREHLFD